MAKTRAADAKPQPEVTTLEEISESDMNESYQMPPKRLVLCFDGTGNAFTGSTSDTNIVKIHDMLDRNNPRQMHYYQRTYDFGLELAC
jgi:uncharacterized protein (DUF2235 family)